ncbi:glycosyltransferase family 2 protein [Salinimicrobium catena]|uniref:glycosyltransferase family 2 protein n=1 Tax=Salinimicrobium catena TaxID=390640 RepID=UPI002FE4EAF3
MKLVSIIIPVLNRAHTLPETLDSILLQTYHNWECIIIDDGSTDNSVNIIQDYTNADERFILVKSNSSNASAARARNKGLQLAKGDLIQFLDSDDILAVNKLEEQVKILDSPLNAFGIATCPWDVFSDIAEPVRINENSPEFKSFNDVKEYFSLIGQIGGYYPPHCFLTPRNVIKKAGYWNENLSLNDDGEFFFRCMINSSKLIYQPNTYVRYRQKSSKGGNLSLLDSKKKAESLINSWKIIEALYLTRFGDKEKPLYLFKKKHSVYWELKKRYPILLYSNKCFFKNEINEDNLINKIKKISRRLKRRWKA